MGSPFMSRQIVAGNFRKSGNEHFTGRMILNWALDNPSSHDIHGKFNEDPAAQGWAQ